MLRRLETVSFQEEHQIALLLVRGIHPIVSLTNAVRQGSLAGWLPGALACLQLASQLLLLAS